MTEKNKFKHWNYKYSKKTEHYEIRSNEPISKTMINFSKIAYQKNKKFFGKDSILFPVNIANTEEEFKFLADKFYGPWVKGTCNFKGVSIRAPKLYKEAYKKFGGTPKLQMVLTHEMTHLFSYFLNLYKGPYWFTEGLAMYVAGQIPKKTYHKKTKLTKEKVEKFLLYRLQMKKLSEEMYEPQYVAIKYLIDNYGLEKLRNLINSYKKNMTKKFYEENFKKIYGISYNKFLKKIINMF